MKRWSETIELEDMSAPTIPQRPPSPDRGKYMEKLIMCFRILPAILDHVSDLPVLFILWKDKYFKLFWLGIGIDLLPGPVAAYQFYILGHRKEMPYLLCHPVNVFVYTMLAMFCCNGRIKTFSKKVVGYVHESQALLESPLQAIFTLTLVCHGILQAPWDKSITWQNSQGSEINLAFFPTLSVAFSLISILFSTSGTVNLVENAKTNQKRTLSWIVFLMSTIMFRLQAWVILCTFLGEFVAIVVLLMFLINMMTLLYSQHKIKIDPFLSSLYSLTFPIALMKSIHDVKKIEEELDFIKQIHSTLTFAGTLLLIASLWTLYFLLPFLEYKFTIIIPRDVLFFFLISTTTLGLVSVASTIFISFPRLLKAVPFPLDSNSGRRYREKTSIFEKVLNVVSQFGLRSIMLLVTLSAIVLPFVWPREQLSVKFELDICGERANATFEGYSYFMTNETILGSLKRCPSNITQDKETLGDKLKPLACIHSPGTAPILILMDHAPATFLPAKLNLTQVIFVPANSSLTRMLTDKTKEMFQQCADDPEIIIATRKGDLQAVKRLVEGGMPVDERSSLTKATALHEAANISDLHLTSYLLDHGANVTATTANGFTALHYAAKGDNVSIAKLLLDRGANLEAQNFQGETPLYVAARAESKELVKYFRAIEANVELKTNRENAGYLHIIKLLIIKDVDLSLQINLIKLLANEIYRIKARYCSQVEASDYISLGCLAIKEFDFIPLSRNDYKEVQEILEGITTVISNLPHIDLNQPVEEINGFQAVSLLTVSTIYAEHGISKILLDKNANPNLADKNSSSTALHYACRYRQIDIINLLLQYNSVIIDPVETSRGWTPLHMCTLNGEVTGMTALLDHEANIEHTNYEGMTPLLSALSKDRMSAALLLATRGANVNATDVHNTSALMYASIKLPPSMAQTLINKSVDYNYAGRNGWTAFMTACSAGNAEVVQYFLEHGYANASSIDADDEGRTPLYLATENNHEKVGEILLAKSTAQLNQATKTGQTPLHVACFYKDASFINLFLQYKDSLIINPVDSDLKQTPLHMCSFYGHIDGLNSLIANGADLERRNKFGNTPLHIAILEGREPTALFLINRAANVNAINFEQYNVSVLQEACHNPKISPALLKVLIDKGADYSYRDGDGWTALTHACIVNNTEAVRFLLDNDYSGDGSPDKSGKTQLHRLALHNNTFLMRLLLEHSQAQLNVGDITGSTPLHMACRNKKPDMIKLLLKYPSILVDAVEETPTKTPLHACSQSGETEGIRLLVEKRADINYRSNFIIYPKIFQGPEGNASRYSRNFSVTPIFQTMMTGPKQIQAALLLVELGADVNALDAENRSVLYWAAKEMPSAELAKVLLDKGADYNQTNSDGMNPFTAACAFNNTEVVRYMLERGIADLNSTDEDGRTPMYWAASNGHREVQQLLLNHGGLYQLTVGDRRGNTPLHIAAINGHLCELEIKHIFKENPWMRVKNEEGLDAEEIAGENCRYPKTYSLLEFKF